jgi:hypothetical protein
LLFPKRGLKNSIFVDWDIGAALLRWVIGFLAFAEGFCMGILGKFLLRLKNGKKILPMT